MSKKLSFDKKVFELLEETNDLTEKEKKSFLHKACEGDTQLLKYCLLTSRFKMSDDYFSQLFFKETRKPEQSYDLIGSIISGFKVKQLIGKGGTADVYLAYRNDSFDNQFVAIKVFRRSAETLGFKKKIKREQVMLSQFIDSNIAKFLESGYTPDDRFYFVLEYVKGIPITDFCKQYKLKLKDILKVFLKVCVTVSKVHEKCTLHGDLKPHNILITNSGTPKLLDFGIAKYIVNDTQSSHLFSPMTPQYASPEQVNQQPLSMASDQFSLGVILYELLAEKLPHDTTEQKLTWVASGGQLASPSERVVSQQPLVSNVTEALNRIVMKAIEREPKKRFESVKKMTQALEEFIINNL